jgi:hypothetical protein
LIRQQRQQNQGRCRKYQAITQLGCREDVDGKFVQGTAAREKQRDDDRPARGNCRMVHRHDPEQVGDEKRQFSRDTRVSATFAPVRDRREDCDEQGACSD